MNWIIVPFFPKQASHPTRKWPSLSIDLNPPDILRFTGKNWQSSVQAILKLQVPRNSMEKGKDGNFKIFRSLLVILQEMIAKSTRLFLWDYFTCNYIYVWQNKKVCKWSSHLSLHWDFVRLKSTLDYQLSFFTVKLQRSNFTGRARVP